MKGFRFEYIERVTRETIVYANSLEEAREKLEETAINNDVAKECEVNFADAELLESWSNKSEE